MKYFLVLEILFLTAVSVSANADTIQIGTYSGKPGYFAKIGNEFQLTIDVIVMNDEVAQKINKLKFEKLGETKICNVNGLQQAIGYTIFKIKSCKHNLL